MRKTDVIAYKTIRLINIQISEYKEFTVRKIRYFRKLHTVLKKK